MIELSGALRQHLHYTFFEYICCCSSCNKEITNTKDTNKHTSIGMQSYRNYWVNSLVKKYKSELLTGSDCMICWLWTN